MLQLACTWNLAHAGVECVVPTLIQEPGADAKPIERKRDELAAVPVEPILSEAEVHEIRRIGDNRPAVLRETEGSRTPPTLARSRVTPAVESTCSSRLPELPIFLPSLRLASAPCAGPEPRLC